MFFCVELFIISFHVVTVLITPMSLKVLTVTCFRIWYCMNITVICYNHVTFGGSSRVLHFCSLIMNIAELLWNLLAFLIVLSFNICSWASMIQKRSTVHRLHNTCFISCEFFFHNFSIWTILDGCQSYIRFTVTGVSKIDHCKQSLCSSPRIGQKFSGCF